MEKKPHPPAQSAEQGRSSLPSILLLGLIAIVLAAGGLVFFFAKSKPAPPPIVEAEGIVTLGGVPLKRVRVTFIPTGDIGPEYFATGTTDNSGHFTLTCNGQPGACACENTVIIEESEVPPNLRGEKNRLDKIKYFESLGGRPLPEKYSNLTQSQLKVTVTDTRKDYDIALTR